jgi:hypothetical protein
VHYNPQFTNSLLGESQCRNIISNWKINATDFSKIRSKNTLTKTSREMDYKELLGRSYFPVGI